MTPYKQLIKHDPKNGQYGDCARTTIACLMDRHPQEVPHFLHDGETDGNIFWKRVDDWLGIFGLRSFGLPFDTDVPGILAAMGNQYPDLYYMLGCASPTADHFVIACGNQIVHDPAGHDPSRLVRGSDGYVWAYVFVPRFLSKGQET